jgi:signal transduction histidine kinase
MNFFHTFRIRLLIVLAILLIVTLGVQYLVNLKNEQENRRLREMQSQALVAGIALGFTSMQSTERLQDFVRSEGQTFFDERTTARIKDIIVINNEWQVNDSLNPDYLPYYDENDQPQKKYLKELTDLPPLMEAERLGEDRKNFPNAETTGNVSEGEAHAILIETDQGRFYVMVILNADKSEAAWKAAQPLVYNLGVLLLSTVITIVLVWRFTRPIANLSQAARQVAEGDLSVRVEDRGRNDEIGQLTSRFNEMTAQLEKKVELEAQLQQAEKSAVVGRLGSAIAHEIRNPLNYINLTLDHLRAKFKPEEPEKCRDFDKLTAQLKAEVARINQQITDFLSYSRPVKATLQPTDVRKVIEDSLRIVEGQAAEQNIKISLIEEEGIPQIMGDPEFLRSVFNNLFINAVQSIEGTENGNLSVKISPDEDFVKIEVADTGKGISEENLPKIFEPYFSTKETGTGLGLAIVKKVLDIHNGTVDAESKLGEGTKFTLKLPKSV